MNMSLKNTKITIKDCYFGKEEDFVCINGRYILKSSGIYDVSQNKHYDSIVIKSKTYKCDEDYEEIKILLEGMKKCIKNQLIL